MAVKQHAQTTMVLVPPGVAWAISGTLRLGLALTDSFYSFITCVGDCQQACATRN